MAARARPQTTTTEPDTDDTADDSPHTTSRRSNRFFSWMRSLGIQRQPGWIGGVCSGIAARLDIDPLIVRGIVVVVAVLGGPAFIVYAAAWLLLPREDDSIHLENLSSGRVESPIAGIGALVVLSMLPMAQGFWYLGSAYWGAPSWGYDLGRALWTIVLLGTVTAFVVWIARRAGRNEPRADSTPVFSPATTDGRPETIPEPGTPDASDSTSTPRTASPPAAPAADASAEELTAWRERQELWKQQNREFKSAEAASQRVVRQQRAAEYRARARLLSAQSAERRRARKLANPVVSAPTVLAVVGAAILAGWPR
jgi:phage shock protein PspC (stress-responsive transcriptional regulator)